MMQWIVPLALILVGLITGIIFEKVVLNKIKRFAVKTRLPGTEILFESLRGITKIWFVLAGFYGAVISLSLNPVFSGSIQKFITVIFLYSVTLFFARLAASFVALLGKTAEGVPATLLSNLASIVVFVFGTLMIVETLGISVTPILTTLGIGGLAVALAFQDTLSNLFSGLYLLISGQVRTGDYVKLETGQEGYVTDITWRNTTIKEIPNNTVIVPNSKLSSAIFTNYYLPEKELTVTIKVGVSYDSDLEQVEQVTIEVAKDVMQEVSSGLTTFEPFIRYHTFGDFSIDFTVFLRVDEFVDTYLAKHKFVKKLHRRYQQEGIKIPFPVKTVYLKENRD